MFRIPAVLSNLGGLEMEVEGEIGQQDPDPHLVPDQQPIPRLATYYLLRLASTTPPTFNLHAMTICWWQQARAGAGTANLQPGHKQVISSAGIK